MQERVRGRSLEGFADCVRSLGGDPAVVFRLAGLDATLLGTPHGWVSFRAILNAYEIASRMLAEPAFGTKLVEFRDLRYLGPLLLYARHSKDLEGALGDLFRYLSIQNTAVHATLAVAEPLATVSIRLPDRLREHANQWIEESLVTLHRTMNEVTGERLPIVHVLLRHAPLRSLRSYAETFGAELRFEQAVDGLQFDAAILGRAIPQADAHVHDFMERYLSERVPRGAEDLVAASNAVMETLIPASQAKLELVAQHLNLHPRTFQRRLHRLGCSFSDLLDDKRRQMAEQLLREGNLPLTHIALCLGYAEQSAFNHAFERWHGVAPSRWQVR